MTLEIKTDKYGNLIPISKSDYEGLKAWIAQDHKLHYPIIINQNGDVLDGHNRLKICRELGIEPRFDKMHFDSELEEERFVRLINVKRRHMNDYEKAKQALALEPIEAKLARKRQISAGQTQTPLGSNEHKGRTRDIVSNDVGLPPTAYFRYKTVIQRGSEEQNKKLSEGKSNISVEYNKITSAEKLSKSREETAAFASKLNLPDKVILLNKDTTKLDELTEIADNSVDLIITDPPYSQDSLPLYEGLANLASKKLKEGGSLVFFVGGYIKYDVKQIFDKFADKEKSLQFWWEFSVIHEGAGDMSYGRSVIIKWKAMMWFVKKGDKKKNKPLMNSLMEDVLFSKKPDKTKHPWAQSHIEAEYFISKLTISEDSLVLDPFLGSGTFAIPAIKLRRYFIGIEVDKNTFENAKNNIKMETETTAAPSQLLHEKKGRSTAEAA